MLEDDYIDKIQYFISMSSIYDFFEETTNTKIDPDEAVQKMEKRNSDY